MASLRLTYSKASADTLRRQTINQIESWLRMDDKALTLDAIQHSNERAAQFLRNRGRLLIDELKAISNRKQTR